MVQSWGRSRIDSLSKKGYPKDLFSFNYKTLYSGNRASEPTPLTGERKIIIRGLLTNCYSSRTVRIIFFYYHFWFQLLYFTFGLHNIRIECVLNMHQFNVLLYWFRFFIFVVSYFPFIVCILDDPQFHAKPHRRFAHK